MEGGFFTGCQTPPPVMHACLPSTGAWPRLTVSLFARRFQFTYDGFILRAAVLFYARRFHFTRDGFTLRATVLFFWRDTDRPATKIPFLRSHQRTPKNHNSANDNPTKPLHRQKARNYRSHDAKHACIPDKSRTHESHTYRRSGEGGGSRSRPRSRLATAIICVSLTGDQINTTYPPVVAESCIEALNWQSDSVLGMHLFQFASVL